MINYLTEEDVLYLHFGVMKSLGEEEQAGVLFKNQLKFAIERPKMISFGVELYPSIWLKTASLVQSLSQEHPFRNGNKRTALVCINAFLMLNRYTLTMPSKYAEDFIVDIVTEKEYKGHDGVSNIALAIENNV